GRLVAGQIPEDTVIYRGPVIDEPPQAVQGHVQATREVCILAILARRDLLDRLWSLGDVRSDIDVPCALQPVPPGEVVILNMESLVGTMVPQAGEEDSASQQRYLEGLEVYVHTIPVPGPRSNPASDEPRE